jgi:hypothetical protein
VKRGEDLVVANKWAMILEYIKQRGRGTGAVRVESV